MFDCIYRDEVKQKIKERMRCLDNVRILFKGDAEALKQIEKCKQVLNQICCDIDDIRTAAVQPMKSEWWITKAEEYYKAQQDSGRSWDDMPYFVTGLKFACSNCFEQFDVDAEGVEKWNYCPRCGARMEMMNSAKL